MAERQRPTLEEFLAAPIDEVRRVAPASLILTTSGSRRRAALMNVALDSDAYPRLSRREMIECFGLIFRHGVRHLFTPAFVETSYQETTPGFRERLIAMADWAVAGPESLADYRRLGLRARLLGAEVCPEMEPTAVRLRQQTPTEGRGTIWYIVSPRPETYWELIFRGVRDQGAKTRRQAIRAVYGEDIPLATLFLGAGKPLVFPSLLPPLLVSELTCYWRQHAGFDLDERTLRTIFYDYAYIQAEATANAIAAPRNAAAPIAYAEPPIIGLGTRLGPFWYTAPIPSPALEPLRS